MRAPLYAFYQGHILMFFANNSVIERFRVKKVFDFFVRLGGTRRLVLFWLV
jgi:hypothetical protein